MYIAQLFSIILISFGAAAVYLGISATRKRFRDYVGNILIGMLSFSSAVWCYGFGLVFLTSDVRIAYWGRTIGMIGVFSYLIFAQILLGFIGDIPKKLSNIFCIFASLGILLYFPVVMPTVTTYFMDQWGMTYTFKPGMVSNIYSVYSLIYAVNMTVSIYYMIKRAGDRRSKMAGYKMGTTFVIVFLGMILDTILPMFGVGAIPGSSISQFIALLVAYYAIVDINKTRLTALNMSYYTYESVSEPVMVCTSDGELRLRNRAADEVFADTFKLQDDEKISVFDIFDLKKDFFDYEDNYRTDDTHSIIGNIPVQIQTSRIHDRFGDVIGFILTIKDMTRINEIMDSLVEAKKLAEADSIAKSTFLANMSHEIRTPLNAIVGFSELLLNGDLNEEEKEKADDIRNSSYNLLAIINDILDISKIASGKMELEENEYYISDVIKDLYLITNTLSERKGISFSMDIEEAIPSKLYGDPVRIRGILVNVLNNAVKYTQRGSVKFEGRILRSSIKKVWLQFKIIDTGIGIRETEQENLFESFFRVDGSINKDTEGTGLGLAIVKGFLELMDGTAEIDSVYGEGTTFTITIPQTIIDDKPVGKITPLTEKEAGESNIGKVKYPGIRVLAVDDNKINLKVITKILSGYEMEVEAVSSGTESVEACSKTNYNLILMDQMMPVMDGIEAMKRIRGLGGVYRAGGECPIVALTANAIAGIREHLIGEGFDDYLSKPVDFEKMETMFSSFFLTDK